MGTLQKLLFRLIGSKSQKIYSEFGDAIVKATKELENTDGLLTELLIDWFISTPLAYFEVLFIDKQSWNKSLVLLLENAEVVNGEESAITSQAFWLWNLELLKFKQQTKNEYSIKEVEHCIKNYFSNGDYILKELERYRYNLHDLPFLEGIYQYIYNVINICYKDSEKITYLDGGLRLDSRLGTALIIQTTEMIKTIGTVSVTVYLQKLLFNSILKYNT